jgi:hypothetical protein
MQSNTKHYKNHSYISNECLDYRAKILVNAIKTKLGTQCVYIGNRV